MVYRTTLAAPVFGLRREIDRLFEDAFGNGGELRRGAVWTPVTDVKEDDRTLTLTVELPGVAPSDVEVTSENGVLTVRGEKQESRTQRDESSRYHIVERTYGGFSRSFQLPKGVDESKIDAQFDRGVLTVRIPRTALPQPRKIQIKAASTGDADAAREVAPVQAASKK
jgi:HSP20 family protein